MITLNLLPQKTKKNIFWRKIFLLTKNIFTLLASLTFFITFTAFGSYYLINNSFQNLKKSQTFLQKQNKNLNSQIKETNAIILKLNNLQKSYVNFANILIYLSEITPHSITLRSLEIKKENNGNNILYMKLSGIAKTRKDLIFYKKLFDTPPFQGANLPFSELLEQKNIKFNLETMFDYSELKKYE